MSDPVQETHEAIARLTVAIRGIQEQYGDTLGVRRLTSDVDRLSADLEELGHPAPGHHPPVSPDDREVIPDDPYDDSMWGDAESESSRAF